MVGAALLMLSCFYLSCLTNRQFLPVLGDLYHAALHTACASRPFLLSEMLNYACVSGDPHIYHHFFKNGGGQNSLHILDVN